MMTVAAWTTASTTSVLLPRQRQQRMLWSRSSSSSQGSTTRRSAAPRFQPLFAVEPKAAENVNPATTTTTTPLPTSTNVEDDDDEDEYEYVEYDNLTEQEFVGSEWLVGTNWDYNPGKIDETWARLVVDAKTGKNMVVWGDNSVGVWTMDVATQFLSLSKENVIAGKEIWACTVSDYYYLQGTVRGWKYWSAAAVIGQWQAKRLGVDPDEAGTPPWFMTTTPTTTTREQSSNDNDDDDES
jgi:hypothetical protein